MNPGRPIVSASSCPTELISIYLDKIVAPIIKSLASYVKDSQHALQIFLDFNFLSEDKLISLWTLPRERGQYLPKFISSREGRYESFSCLQHGC